MPATNSGSPRLSVRVRFRRRWHRLAASPSEQSCLSWSLPWLRRQAWIPLVAGTSLLFLALLGGLAAHAGGARVIVGAIRVTFWGALAMAITSGVGWLFGTVA